MSPQPYFHASATSWGPNQPLEPTLGIGLYEVSIWEGTIKHAWFFIDYRTADFPGTLYNPSNPDIQFEYDVSNKNLEFILPVSESVINGKYYSMWEIRDNVTLYTEDLEDYWENCLAVFDNGDSHPRFAWGSFPWYSNNYYKIYKKKGTPDFILFDSTHLLLMLM